MNEKKFFKKEEPTGSGNVMTLFHLFPNDNVSADVYNEQIDLYYCISGITVEQLMQILRNDKHLYLECIVHREFMYDKDI